MLATRPADLALAEKHGVFLARRTVCLDFDGVIHSYRSGWCGSDVIPDPPIHGTREAVARLRKTYRVVIHSSRCHTPEGRDAIAHWLAKHGIEVDEVCEHKPPAVVYVDDRAIPFRGDWDQVMHDISPVSAVNIVLGRRPMAGRRRTRRGHVMPPSRRWHVPPPPRRVPLAQPPLRPLPFARRLERFPAPLGLAGAPVQSPLAARPSRRRRRRPTGPA
jgi:hypothetical protein